MTQEEQYHPKLLLSIYPCKVSFTVGVKNDKPKKLLGTYYPGKKRIIIHTGKRDKYNPVETAIHAISIIRSSVPDKRRQPLTAKNFGKSTGNL